MKPSSGLVIEKVKNAGVVGAGGAGFPTHVKLAAKVETVIANAASCEPLVNSDFAIIKENPDNLVKAMTLVLNITEAKEGFIALKSKHKGIIQLLKKAIANNKDDRIKLYLLDDFYPAGDEFILTYEITNKTIPERALPLEVGCLIHNVMTLIQIYDAYEGKPVTSRYVTITGEVNKPLDIMLPIGTSFKEAINVAGGTSLEDFRVIHGGPMMGNLVKDIESETVMKTTSMILVLPSDHVLIQKNTQPIETTIKRAKSVCCQCTQCTELCPRGLIGHPLEPHKIMRSIAYNISEPFDNITSAFICSECGLCSLYACTMGLMPHKVNAEIKSALMKKEFKYIRSKQTYKTDNELRSGRKVPTSRLISRLNLTKYKDKELTVINDYKPDSVAINLQQHIGVKSLPTVKVGDTVEIGDLIATIPENKLGATLHASIKGKVSEINDNLLIIKG